MVEDPAAACRRALWIWIHSYASAIAKLLRLAFQAQSRSVRRFERQKATLGSAAVVEDPAAACRRDQWIWIHSYASAIAKLLRLAFQTQSRSVRRFERQSGSHDSGRVASRRISAGCVHEEQPLIKKADFGTRQLSPPYLRRLRRLRRYSNSPCGSGPSVSKLWRGSRTCD